MALLARTRLITVSLAAVALAAVAPPLAAQETAAGPPPSHADAGQASAGSAEVNQKDAAATSPVRRIDRPFSAGAFVGADYFGDQIELGDSYAPDEIPGSAVILGLRGAYVLVPHLAPGNPLDPSLSVEAELAFAASSTLGDMASGRTSRFAPVFGWRAHALLDLLPSQKLSPFMVLGLGGETISSSSPFIASPDTDAALYWGVGARYDLSPRYGLRFDARQAVTTARTESATFTYEAHLGVYFRFGFGHPPPPPRAEAPPKPAPKPKAQPPVDTDGDGIPDALDKCPNAPEDKDGFQDADGCPDPDNDHDGIPDARDKCPNAAEDKDGFQDADGCPDPDNDGDKILDVVDACPNEPETLNGYEDTDGCPDQVPKAVARFTGTIKGIYFKTGSAKIRHRSHRILDKAVKVLKAHPSVRIEVSGYTDSRGTRALNMRLSRKRADSVKWYLVDHGVAQDRITTVGYGPDRPIADNSTRRGRAKNRRIEFHLVSTPPPPAPKPKPAAAAKSKPGAAAKPRPGAAAKSKPAAAAKSKPGAAAKSKPAAQQRPAKTPKAKPAAPRAGPTSGKPATP